MSDHSQPNADGNQTTYTYDPAGLLAEKARRGVEVRLLISYATHARLVTDTPIDEPYPDPEPPAVYDIAAPAATSTPSSNRRDQGTKVRRDAV